MTNFQLEDFARRGGKLLEDTRKVFDEYKGLGFGKVELPQTMQPSEGAVKLVFVGQYSAGKSSIIKMLSGIETEIGAGIKTQEAHTYKWGDIEIIDTPGIHTELRPDHDEKTYYEIDHAALLIFVVTNEGFDDRMGNHFRKLAVEQERGKNMVLVVNKMDRTAQGNTEDQQNIIADDLVKVITPYSKEDLYLSFLDTESYFDWQDETDEEMKAILLEQSGYEKFVENLNSFVASRGLLSKIQAPLETLKSAIITTVGNLEVDDIDRDIEAMEELLKRRQKALLDGKHRIKVEIEELANTCAQKIKNEGSKAANSIMPGVSEEEADRNIKAAQMQSDIYMSNCEDEMIERLSEICEDVNKEILRIDHSKFSFDVHNNLGSKSTALAVVPQQQNNVAAFAQGLAGNQIILNALNMTSKGAAQIGLPILGNIKAASIVKDVGHFFGKTFRPWEAVNFVKGATKVLGVIGVAITAYQLWQHFKGNDKEKEVQKNIRYAQNQIQESFNKVAEESRTEIVKAATDKMDELTAPELKKADEQLAEFHNKKDMIKNFGHRLQKILGEVEELMGEVQRTAKA